MRKLDEKCRLKSEFLPVINLINLRFVALGEDYADKENLKEMGDVSSGMASTVIQAYLKHILDCFVHPHVLVRHAALKVVSLILNQGLVYPVQIVPYLVCLSTDYEQKVHTPQSSSFNRSVIKHPFL